MGHLHICSRIVRMVAYSPLASGLASIGGGGGALGITRGAVRGAETVVTVRVRGALGFVVRGVEGRDGFARHDKPRR